MKAVILAAGKGSRILGITNDKPKSLLPFGDTTLLGHSLALFQEAGITEIILVTGFKRDVIRTYASDNWPGKLTIVFNPHYASTNVLYSFWLAIPYIENDDFVFLHADTVFSKNILSNLLACSSETDVTFTVDRHTCYEEEMKVIIEQGKVTWVTKEMPPESADGEFLGLALVKAAMLPSLRDVAESFFEKGNFQAFFEAAIQTLIDEQGLSVGVCDVTGLAWREVDFIEDYKAALEIFFGQAY
ncbi:phosphocholine cytidylyltransferase family protein [Oxalobacter sp. OttesenSCG-928-P03]|nr:phosphocholine cytidylyltransferase family protein [Oxalobacter sp. OttesenSCG-928-P03]